MNPWYLPESLYFAGKEHGINGDFRDILEIFSYFQDPELPDYLKWQIALALFYREPVPVELQQQAAEAMCGFLNAGAPEPVRAERPLIDWRQDAFLIAADINRSAGVEIRKLPFLHWWTFLGYFHTVGEGQLSAVVTIRAKLRRGEKLTDWEKRFCRENPGLIRLRVCRSGQEQAEQDRLRALLTPRRKENEHAGA